MKRKKYYRGSMTVETACIMPVFILMFILIMRMTFYFHDKIILYGAAAETAAVGIEADRVIGKEEMDLQNYFKKRLGHKMIYFRSAESEISVNDEEVVIKAEASKKRMRISACVKMPITEPEKKIRIIQGIKAAVKKQIGTEE